MYNESKKRAAMRYMATLKEIRFRVKPDYYDKICAAASAEEFPSIRRFILYCIDRELKKYNNG